MTRWLKAAKAQWPLALFCWLVLFLIGVVLRNMAPY